MTLVYAETQARAGLLAQVATQAALCSTPPFRFLYIPLHYSFTVTVSLTIVCKDLVLFQI